MPLTNIAMADTLSSLVLFDIRAVKTYRHVAPSVSAGCVKNQLVRFRTDHERHIHQLCAVIRALDSEPPSPVPGFKACPLQTVAQKPLVKCPTIPLHIIKIDEELINRLYSECCLKDFTPSIKELVKTIYREEQLHLRYLGNLFSSRRLKELRQVA